MKTLFLVLLLTLVPFATAPVSAQDPVKFQWDYQTESIDQVAGFRLFQKDGDAATYDYDNPILDLSIEDATGVDANTIRTFDQEVPIEKPTGKEGTLYFVLRAYDAAGNESGDSNEVGLPYDTLGPPAVIRFQLIVSTP